MSVHEDQPHYPVIIMISHQFSVLSCVVSHSKSSAYRSSFGADTHKEIKRHRFEASRGTNSTRAHQTVDVIVLSPDIAPDGERELMVPGSSLGDKHGKIISLGMQLNGWYLFAQPATNFHMPLAAIISRGG